MTMTYAAQVRSMSKSLPKQTIQNDIYDLNSLRIICQYFVGSIVMIKTVDEIVEGILHTISNNKICLTLVTVAKQDNPDMLTKVLSSQMVSLSEVLSISTKNANDTDVTVKGKHLMKRTPENERLSKFNKAQKESIVHKIPDKKSVTPIVIENSVMMESAEKTFEEVKKPEIGAKKNTFSFNPHAPEFRPRPIVVVEPPPPHPTTMLFSPSPYPQQVFSPASAPTPAIFVPNVFFYAAPSPSVSALDSNNAGSISSSGMDNDYHHHPVMPVFPHPMPIFIPHGAYGRVRHGPACTSESGTSTASTSATVASEAAFVSVAPAPAEVDIELSNLNNWPPLPNPAVPEPGRE